MRGSVVPFGYEELLDKPGYVTPITKELEALDKAIDMVKEGTLTYAAASEWLEFTSGRKISRQGLHNLMKRRDALQEN